MKKFLLISIILLSIINSGCIRKNDHDKEIYKDSTLIKDLQQTPIINEILFVGMLGKKSGLCKYNFSSKEYSEYWKNDKEEVVELSYSPYKKSAFMLTASQSGKKGAFPFINNIKLYSLNLDSDSVAYIEHIGVGLQVFSTWTSDTSFQVYVHIMDVTTAKYVEQNIKTYNASGKKLFDENKKYYLAKEGFPQFPIIKKNLISLNKKYSIFAVDSVQTQIYLIDNTKNNEKAAITKQNQKLNRVEWSDDGKVLVFSTIDITPGNETLYYTEPNTSKLFVYSLSDRKILKIFDGGGLKNFMLNGNLLIFDDGFKKKAKIFIYDFNLGQMIDSIKISGGCGLKNIPTIPDYGA